MQGSCDTKDWKQLNAKNKNKVKIKRKLNAKVMNEVVHSDVTRKIKAKLNH